MIKIMAIASDAFWKSYNNSVAPAGPEYTYPDVPLDGKGNCRHRPPYESFVFKKLKTENFYLTPIIYGKFVSNLWNVTFKGVRIWRAGL